LASPKPRNSLIINYYKGSASPKQSLNLTAMVRTQTTALESRL
jgi:hypothetical protein